MFKITKKLPVSKTATLCSFSIYCLSTSTFKVQGHVQRTIATILKRIPDPTAVKTSSFFHVAWLAMFIRTPAWCSQLIAKKKHFIFNFSKLYSYDCKSVPVTLTQFSVVVQVSLQLSSSVPTQQVMVPAKTIWIFIQNLTWFNWPWLKKAKRRIPYITGVLENQNNLTCICWYQYKLVAFIVVTTETEF